jgi:hypothetical protein
MAGREMGRWEMGGRKEHDEDASVFLLSILPTLPILLG